MRSLVLAIVLAIAACAAPTEQSDGEAMIDIGASELVVLAAPMTGDAYYADVVDDIFAFHVAFGEALVANGDRMLVLTDEGAYARYAEVLGADAVAIWPLEDIWARDYGPANPAQPILFRYTAEGQGGGRKGQRDADAVQAGIAELLEAAGLNVSVSQLLNDGGNWVDDYTGNAVLSRKFMADNRMDVDEAVGAIRAATGAREIAFIEADEQGGLEHADGVVAFVDPNVLVVNSYPDDPDYATQLRADLTAGLPGAAIHEIVTPHDGSDVYDARFGSACGLYTNMLVTPERIYLPQFGIPEDAEALATIRAITDKRIIPVQSGGVCHMGGGLRCMSLQLRGVNAGKLLGYIVEKGGPAPRP